MALVNPCCPTSFNNILICYEISWWFQWHQIGVLKHQFHLNKWKINSVWDLIQEACYAWDFLLFFSTYLIFCFNFLVSTTVCGEIIWTRWSPFFHIVLLFLSVFYFMLSEDPRNRVSFIIPAQGSRRDVWVWITRCRCNLMCVCAQCTVHIILFLKEGWENEKPRWLISVYMDGLRIFCPKSITYL